MSASLVGSEMCIRDSARTLPSRASLGRSGSERRTRSGARLQWSRMRTSPWTRSCRLGRSVSRAS
eukprot:11538251-Alexandrium_andersonii.AAC.1